MTYLRGLGRKGRRGWKILLLTGGGTNQEGREGGSPDTCFNPVMHYHRYLPSFLLYATINGLLVLAAVLLTLFIGPAAAGSGISEVKVGIFGFTCNIPIIFPITGDLSKYDHPLSQAFLNGVDVPGIFHFRTLVAKLFGAVGSVAGGLAVGKEGPFVHAGAAIAAILSQVTSIYNELRAVASLLGGHLDVCPTLVLLSSGWLLKSTSARVPQPVERPGPQRHGRMWCGRRSCRCIPVPSGRRAVCV